MIRATAREKKNRPCGFVRNGANNLSLPWLAVLDDLLTGTHTYRRTRTVGKRKKERCVSKRAKEKRESARRAKKHTSKEERMKQKRGRENEHRHHGGTS
jgi:hypothetical protein